MHTGSKAWRALRAIVLEEELYKCRWCGKFGDHVDHIDGKAEDPEDYRRDNLQCLCFRCHSIKTAQENGGFGNDKVDRPSFDAQGNPIGKSHWNS